MLKTPAATQRAPTPCFIYTLKRNVGDNILQFQLGLKCQLTWAFFSRPMLSSFTWSTFSLNDVLEVQIFQLKPVFGF